MSFWAILLLAIAVAKIAAFQSTSQVTPRNSVSAVTELRMSGNYYIKDDDAGTDKTTLTEIGGRTIDRLNCCNRLRRLSIIIDCIDCID